MASAATASIRASTCGARRSVLALLVMWVIGSALLAPAARAALAPEQDPFYTYDGARPLTTIAPGAILKARVVHYHVIGLPLPIRVVQLLYRSTGQLGQPTINVTSVLRPRFTRASPRSSPTSRSTTRSIVTTSRRTRSPEGSPSGAVADRRVRAHRPRAAAWLHDRRAGHRGPERGLRRRAGVRLEHARFTPRRVSLARRGRSAHIPGSDSSATRVARSQPIGPPSSRRGTRPGSTGGSSAPRWAACSLTRRTTSITSTGAASGQGSCRWPSSACPARSTST